MNRLKIRYYLNVLGWIVGMCFIATASAQNSPPNSADTSVGTVLVTAGNLLSFSPDRPSRPLNRGSLIFSGELLKQGEGSSQISFTDGAIVSLKPNTELKIDAYAFNDPVKENQSLFNLITGGFRTITGLIAQQSPESYALKTAVATIGVRGTSFEVGIYEANVLPELVESQNDLQLGVRVFDGSVTVKNAFGELAVFRDTHFAGVSPNQAPRPLDISQVTGVEAALTDLSSFVASADLAELVSESSLVGIADALANDPAVLQAIEDFFLSHFRGPEELEAYLKEFNFP